MQRYHNDDCLLMIDQTRSSYLAALAGVDSVVKSRSLVSTDPAQNVVVVVEFWNLKYFRKYHYKHHYELGVLNAAIINFNEILSWHYWHLLINAFL